MGRRRTTQASDSSTDSSDQHELLCPLCTCRSCSGLAQQQKRRRRSSSSASLHGGDEPRCNLATAFTTCAATMRKVVKKMQLSRNDEQCYSYDDIMAWVQAEYADDACVLQK